MEVRLLEYFTREGNQQQEIIPIAHQSGVWVRGGGGGSVDEEPERRENTYWYWYDRFIFVVLSCGS